MKKPTTPTSKKDYIELCIIPRISTAHLPAAMDAETCLRLIYPRQVLQDEFGLLVCTRTADEGEKLPDWFVVVCAWANKRGYSHVWFDADAVTAAELPVFEWE